MENLPPKPSCQYCEKYIDYVSNEKWGKCSIDNSIFAPCGRCNDFSPNDLYKKLINKTE